MVSKKERAEDLRLRRIYNISLEEKKAKLKNQNYCCAMCHKPFGNKRVFIDHSHIIAKAKIITTSIIDMHKKKLWLSRALDKTVNEVLSSSYKRNEAIKTVRNFLKRTSVRGILCFVCNQKILGRLERFKVPLQAIIDYLERYDGSNRLLMGGRWKPDTK